ncbi:MAG: DNA replication/repair protein RecF [Chitinophagaceae bacterium]|nr:DNA replication/repair protein RecF [Chitinophagaceae bacterium]MCW5914421.1 DNA replication/repair protein RecF [Chitinophagaceae bacterium]MCZ2397182.1 DNA replication and repair protein RecF [Chitinophagales bacterium]
MWLNAIKLTGYKNYDSGSFSFHERIVGICGKNGRGKTNLLDAINYLCLARSYFTRTEALNIHFGSPGFRIEGTITDDRNEKQHIVCIFREGGKKELYLNDIPYEKFSKHIGKFPCVLIAPDDISLINGNSDERRKYLDTTISQIDERYLQQLILYNKILAQRNALLKYESGGLKYDEVLLQSYNQKLVESGNFIHSERKAFTARLFPAILRYYASIAGSPESVTISYESQLLEQAFDELLISSHTRDLHTQRTNVGIHKDEIRFVLEQNPFKAIASQGQKKSLLFACKLAEYEILKEEKGFAPILLLDDVFEKLDESRIHNLIEFICSESGTQVFITDTDSERLQKIVAGKDTGIQIIKLN